MKSSITAIAISLLSATMFTPAISAKTLHVRPDVSGSNPIVTSDVYAQVIARRVVKEIQKLELGNRITFRTFGALVPANDLGFEAQLSRRKGKPQAVAAHVAKLITSIPEGRIEPQERTEILAELQWGEYDCAAGDIILLATDGIETGSMIKSATSLMEGKEQLPVPESTYLEGCEVIMLGMGKTETGSWPSATVNNLIRAWKQYLQAAGAKVRIIVNP